MNQRQTVRETDRGQVMLLTVLLLMAGSFIIVAGMFAVIRSQLIVTNELTYGTLSYIAAEGALEEVVYRYMEDLSVDATENHAFSAVNVTVLSTAISGGTAVTATGNKGGRLRSVRADLLAGDAASFSFGVQTDTGGIILENSSSVNGNVYSNGPIIGHNLNLVRGTAISAGPSGFISDIHATGSAYAHEIDASYIEGDAFYQVIDVGTVVDGTSHPSSPDLATTSLPITDELLDQWADYASTSGSSMAAECIAAGGTLVIDTDTTLGPVVIPCNVEFEKFPIITIEGVVWIQGDVTFTQGPEFEIAAAIGNKSVPIIVDDPNNRLTSGRVVMRNSGEWRGNGDRSYIMVVSRNESAEQGGTEKAVLIEQSTGGSLLVYARHGEITLQNNTDLTEITAFRVRLENLTEVIYDTGLASAIFVVGPNTGYVIDSWSEVE